MMRRLPLACTILLSASAYANGCADRAWNSTLRLSTPDFIGAGATIVHKEIRGGKLDLLAYTDFHVVRRACPKLQAGQECQVHVMLGTTCGGKSIDGDFALHLEKVDDTESLDLAVVSIHGITPVDPGKPFACVESLPTVLRSPAGGVAVLRVGYPVLSHVEGRGRGQHTVKLSVKTLRRGHFVGFADVNPLFKKPAVPAGQGAGRPPTFKAVSDMPIVPGDCGGPVVEAATCGLIATSQLGPDDGRSSDIPAVFLERLAGGKTTDHLEASRLLNPVVSWKWATRH